MSSPSQHQSNDRPKRHGRRARRVVASDDPSVLRCRYLCLVSILSGLLCHRASASFSSLNLRPSIGQKASSRNKSLAPGRRPAVDPPIASPLQSPPRGADPKDPTQATMRWGTVPNCGNTQWSLLLGWSSLLIPWNQERWIPWNQSGPSTQVIMTSG